MSTEIEVFTYEGHEISIDPTAQMWNLNTMHEAAGAPANKAPAQWLRGAQARELLTALSEEQTVGISHSLVDRSGFVETRDGRSGGTWARREIALAYAHYLKPHFYIACNRWMLRQLDSRAFGGQSTDPARLAALEARVAALEAQPLHSFRQLARSLKRPPLTTDRILAMLGAAGGQASQMDLYTTLRLENIPLDELITVVGRMQRGRLITVEHRISGFGGNTHTTTYTLTTQGREAYQLTS